MREQRGTELRHACERREQFLAVDARVVLDDIGWGIGENVKFTPRVEGAGVSASVVRRCGHAGDTSGKAVALDAVHNCDIAIHHAVLDIPD